MLLLWELCHQGVIPSYRPFVTLLVEGLAGPLVGSATLSAAGLKRSTRICKLHDVHVTRHTPQSYEL